MSQGKTSSVQRESTLSSRKIPMPTSSKTTNHPDHQSSERRRRFFLIVVSLLLGLAGASQCNAQAPTASSVQNQEVKDAPVFRSSTFLEEDGGNLGACVGLRGSVQNREDGHVYELRYMIRVQNAANKDATILGDKTRPEGVCYTASTSKGRQVDQYGFLRLNAEVDITRRFIRQLSNMPKPDQSSYIVLRIEPHIFDVTSGKYVSETRPESFVMVASVRKGGYVSTLNSLSNFLNSRGSSGKSEFVKVCQILQSLDHFDCSDNELPNALAGLLEKEHLGDEIRLMLLNVIQPDWVRGPKEELEGTIQVLVNNSTNEQIKKRARTLLGE